MECYLQNRERFPVLSLRGLSVARRCSGSINVSVCAEDGGVFAKSAKMTSLRADRRSGPAESEAYPTPSLARFGIPCASQNRPMLPRDIPGNWFLRGALLPSTHCFHRECPFGIRVRDVAVVEGASAAVDVRNRGGSEAAKSRKSSRHALAQANWRHLVVACRLRRTCATTSAPCVRVWGGAKRHPGKADRAWR